LEKQATEYGALQVSLDEMKQQCIDKDLKLQQLQERLDKQEVRNIDILLGYSITSLLTGVKGKCIFIAPLF